MKLILTAKAKGKGSKKERNKRRLKQYYNVLFPMEFVNKLTANKK